MIIEVKKEVGSGGSIFNPEFKITELHQATTNDKGEFEMAFTSENVTLKIKFIKEYMYTFNSGTNGGYINSGTTIILGSCPHETAKIKGQNGINLLYFG